MLLKILIQIHYINIVDIMSDKIKYLVPKDMYISQFVFVIRKRIQLEPSESLFVMINHQLPRSNALIGDIYEEQHNKDGFLYVTYTSENTFG